MGVVRLHRRIAEGRRARPHPHRAGVNQRVGREKEKNPQPKGDDGRATRACSDLASVERN